ncbi:hypothetical protein SEUBUCD646_0P00740 [Saccharomyces eubayanus]|uniref:WAC domain-containing protein n=1 Tax=Saccharomyces eubayanus TaxID=1080349 RepID=A0ABN8VI01_SACEU|nr:hypothetical protein SEUBUCD650_0P00750 [Saccharomyces eubayanus]CAI1782103.1 hypothetical protein SEUBUCD646_0P00740 [Saccharomyces eubayanus]
MVLLNRKEVQLDGRELATDTTDRNTWEIKETGERISGYDNYLKRLEFMEKKYLLVKLLVETLFRILGH